VTLGELALRRHREAVEAIGAITDAGTCTFAPGLQLGGPLLQAPDGRPYVLPEVHTRTLTLVIQAVVRGDESFNKRIGIALLDYALATINGTGGNSQFERHVTANNCRIEAIASIAPIPGDEAREGLVSGDATQALRDRLEVALEMTRYLPGGDATGEITSALGYSPEKAASELRDQITEALEALGVQREEL
jgi:hypothetical protein